MWCTRLKLALHAQDLVEFCHTLQTGPLHVYITLCKYGEKSFLLLYKLTFPRKKAKLFVMAMIKREILTSCEVEFSTKSYFKLGHG